MRIFLGVNKNGNISLHIVEPKRNNDNGTWISNRPYVNSVVYNNLSKMIKHSKMTWEHEPEVLEIDLKRIES